LEQWSVGLEWYAILAVDSILSPTLIEANSLAIADTNLELIPATVPLATSFYFSSSGNPVINVMYPSTLEHVIVDYQVPGDGWNTGGEVSVTININSSIGLITSQRFYALVGNEIQEYSQQANGSFTLTSVITTNF
jgi:hypothetical protein